MFGLTSFFFGAVAVVIMLALGATMVSIFGTVKDQASSWAERVLGWALLLCLTTGFLGLLVFLIVLAIL